MGFAGFSKKGVGFFKTLALTQDREWFRAHKQDYVELWEEPMAALLEGLAGPLAKIYKGRALEEPKQFRIYRDVRFAKDKSPFKTHGAGVVSFKGGMEQSAPAALYLQLGLEDFAGAGHWGLPGARLLKYRKLVAEDRTGRALQKKVDALVRKGFTVEAFETLKRVPPGFAPDHPRAALLRNKGLGLGFPKMPASVRFSAQLLPWLVDCVKQTAPLTLWLEAQLPRR